MDEDYIEFADKGVQRWAISKAGEILDSIRELMEEHEELSFYTGVDVDVIAIYHNLQRAAEETEIVIQKCKDGVILNEEDED